MLHYKSVPDILYTVTVIKEYCIDWVTFLQKGQYQFHRGSICDVFCLNKKAAHIFIVCIFFGVIVFFWIVFFPNKSINIRKIINAINIDNQNFLQVSSLTQVWTPVWVTYGSKIQDFQKVFLGSMVEILEILHLGSWIHKSLRLESRLESDLKPEGNVGYLFLLHLLCFIYWLIYDA